MITINGTEFIQKEYPVGEQILEFSNEILKAISISNGIVIDWHYKDDKDFMTLWFIVHKLKDLAKTQRYYYKPLAELKIPYLPYARMDRIKEEKQFFSLKYVADFINSLGFEKVIINDAHSDVSLSLINNVKNNDMITRILTEEFMKDHNVSNCVVCFPDKTAVKRYGHLSNYFHGAISIEKVRDFNTGKLLSFDLKVLSDNSDFDNKEVVIIDDICSYGGTFIGAIEEMKKYWKLDGFHLIVSHLEKSFYDGKLKECPDLLSVTTSNSFDYNFKGDTNV